MFLALLCVCMLDEISCLDVGGIRTIHIELIDDAIRLCFALPFQSALLLPPIKVIFADC